MNWLGVLGGQQNEAVDDRFALRQSHNGRQRVALLGERRGCDKQDERRIAQSVVCGNGRT